MTIDRFDCDAINNTISTVVEVKRWHLYVTTYSNTSTCLHQMTLNQLLQHCIYSRHTMLWNNQNRNDKHKKLHPSPMMSSSSPPMRQVSITATSICFTLPRYHILIHYQITRVPIYHLMLHNQLTTSKTFYVIIVITWMYVTYTTWWLCWSQQLDGHTNVMYMTWIWLGRYILMIARRGSCLFEAYPQLIIKIRILF